MFTDYSAPRFNKRKFRKNIVSEELYDKWKLENPNFNISFSEFRNICYLINSSIADIICEERDGVRLPKGMGDIYLGYIPDTTKKPVDYIVSTQLKKVVFLENWNTGGKMGKIIYGCNNRKYVYKTNLLWAFEGSTTFKEKAKNGFRNNPERYKNTIENR